MKRNPLAVVLIVLAIIVSFGLGWGIKSFLMLPLRKCVYTSTIDGSTITICALRCPVHPDWKDAGICR